MLQQQCYYCQWHFDVASDCHASESYGTIRPCIGPPGKRILPCCSAIIALSVTVPALHCCIGARLPAVFSLKVLRSHMQPSNIGCLINQAQDTCRCPIPCLLPSASCRLAYAASSAASDILHCSTLPPHSHHTHSLCPPPAAAH